MLPRYIKKKLEWQFTEAYYIYFLNFKKYVFQFEQFLSSYRVTIEKIMSHTLEMDENFLEIIIFSHIPAYNTKIENSTGQRLGFWEKNQKD